MINSVYQKVLGNEFEKLSPLMQEVHGSVEHVLAFGKIDVEYGKGGFIRIMNKMNGLPPEGKNQELQLEITRSLTNEVWKRSFKASQNGSSGRGDIFSTTQFERKGLMVEKSGLINFGFNLITKEGAMYFQQKFMRFAGIPVPKIFGVQTKASCAEENGSWCVTVEVRSPLFGLMLKYSGIVQLKK